MILKTVLLWIKTNPVTAFIIGLIASLAAASARAAFWRRKVESIPAKESADNHKAAEKASKSVERQLAAADKVYHAAKQAEADAMSAAEKARLEREAIAAKWKTLHVLVFAALSLALLDPAQPGATEDTPLSVAPTCSPDADLSGLLAAVKVTLAKLDGLDREAVSDLMTVVGTYRDERESLCAALHQADMAAEVAEKTREMQAKVADIWQADAETCHAALKALPLRRVFPLGWCGGGGLTVSGDGQLRAGGAVIYGIRW